MSRQKWSGHAQKNALGKEKHGSGIVLDILRSKKAAAAQGIGAMETP